MGLTWQPLQAPIQPALPRPCNDRFPESTDIFPLLTVWGRRKASQILITNTDNEVGDLIAAVVINLTADKSYGFVQEAAFMTMGVLK